MQAKASLIEPLLERVEEYGRSSVELIKLKSIDKTADISSTLASRLILMIVIVFCVIALNIAAALWLGELLGKNYYGFLVVGGFYAVVSVVLLCIHPLIKTRVNNSIIAQMFK